MADKYTKEIIDIPIDDFIFKSVIKVPHNPQGIILFGYLNGGRHSPSDNLVASTLREARVATLFFNLLTEEESLKPENHSNVELLTDRYIKITNWVKTQKDFKKLPIGFFGERAGASGALKAASILGSKVVKAVVSQSGRPDLIMDILDQIKPPILLITGEKDKNGIKINQQAYDQIITTKKLEIISEVGENFEGREDLQKVADLASDWFKKYLVRKTHKQQLKPYRLENFLGQHLER